MNIKEYYSKFVFSLGTLIVATLSGLIVLAVDKHWNPKNPSENVESEQEIRREVAGIDAQKGSIPIEPDTTIKQEQPDFLGHQHKTLEPYSSELDNLDESGVDRKQGNRKALQIQSDEKIKTPKPVSTQAPTNLKSELKSKIIEPPFSSSNYPQKVFSIERIFEGERIDLCGYEKFSVKSLDHGARFEISTEDRRMPNREFTGWHSTITSGKVTSITPSCKIIITSELAGGNRLIYFKISQGGDL